MCFHAVCMSNHNMIACPGYYLIFVYVYSILSIYITVCNVLMLNKMSDNNCTHKGYIIKGVYQINFHTKMLITYATPH